MAAVGNSASAMQSRENGTVESPAVTAVVLNWYSAAATRRCLAALRALDYDNLSIVLIDNECADFAAEQLPRDPPLEYLHSPTNLGFAGGCNLGLSRALDSGADFVWFVNNDAEPEPDALRCLIAAAATAPEAGIFGAKILRTGTDPPRLDSIALAIDRRSGRYRMLGHDEIDSGTYDDRDGVDAVTGCAMLLRTNVARHLGGFDERYFLYLEDVDLCLRARAVGARTACVPTARVWHDRPAAVGNRQSADSLYYTCRNHLLLMDTHGEGGAAVKTLRRAAVVALNIAYALRGAPGSIPRRLAAVIAGARDWARARFGARHGSVRFNDVGGT